MYDASDIRKGLKIKLDDKPYVVIEFQFVKPGKGQAFTKTRIKNLITGAVLERSFRSGDRLEPADVEEKEMQFLYREGDGFHFMDNESYDQISIPLETVGATDAGFLQENSKVMVTIYEGRPVAISLPNFVELRVDKTDPGVRGDTATGASKPATLSTGAVIQVPLFVDQGDVLRIDTRTGQYVERA